MYIYIYMFTTIITIFINIITIIITIITIITTIIHIITTIITIISKALNTKQQIQTLHLLVRLLSYMYVDLNLLIVLSICMFDIIVLFVFICLLFYVFPIFDVRLYILKLIRYCAICFDLVCLNMFYDMSYLLRF